MSDPPTEGNEGEGSSLDPKNFSVVGAEQSETSRPWLCLVGLVESDHQTALLEELKAFNLTATLFVAPEVLVQSPRTYDGPHELGNGALVDATIDGELGRWTIANLDAELDAADDLLCELGFSNPTSVFLPGHQHMSADGPYRRHVQMRYPVAISNAATGCSVLGARGALSPITLGHTNLEDLAPILTLEPPHKTAHVLIVSGEPLLRGLRESVFDLVAQRLDTWHIGPLRDLLLSTQAYSIS